MTSSLFELLIAAKHTIQHSFSPSPSELSTAQSQLVRSFYQGLTRWGGVNFFSMIPKLTIVQSNKWGERVHGGFGGIPLIVFSVIIHTNRISPCSTCQYAVLETTK